MTLDATTMPVIQPAVSDSGAILSAPLSSGSRWFCAWVHEDEEHRAAQHLANQAFQTYLPLHVERRSMIVPLFPGYLFVSFDPDVDPWGKIRSTRGVGGLIRHGTIRPTAIHHGVIEDLMARTSLRGVVDDPGDAPPVGIAGGVKASWRNLGALSKQDRVAVLYRLFGAGVAESEA